MGLGLFLMLITVGLMAGWLAWIVMKGGGYGLIGDLFLGLIGSTGGSLIFWALGVSPGAGLLALTVVAFLGAALVIVAQRQFWYARA
jgi:uncharacterized membrane protein YeaQ/YmgE (transglycosylase-associated protein family)